MHQRLDIKDPTEYVVLTFDFAAELATGETLTTTSVSVTTVRGDDATPSAILNGPAALNAASTAVLQPVKGGASGCEYQVKVVAQTTNAQKILARVGVLPVSA